MVAVRRLLILGLLVLLLAASASATSYELTVRPINNTLEPGESATFELRITNFENKRQRFQIFTVDPTWTMRVEPFLHAVEPKSVSTHTVTLRPTTATGFGTRGTSIRIKHLDSGEIIDKNVVITYIDPERPPGVYRPSVSLDVRMASSVEPGGALPLDIELRNRNPRNLTVFTEVSSPLFDHSYTTELLGLAERTEGVTFPIDELQAPGEYNVKTRVIFENETLSESSKAFTVETVESVERTPTDYPGYFRSRTELLVKNTGNVPTTYDAMLPTNWFRALFSSTEPETSVQQVGGERYYVWELRLGVDESARVSVREDYRLLVVLAIILIVGVLGYYLMRSPLIAVKETVALEGEGRNLKVRIFLKNRTGKAIGGVSVVDRVPSIATYKRAEQLGMLSPTKVVSDEKKGTMLKWEVDVLEPYEERILSYNLESKLQIVGRFKLPSAKVKFQRGRRERVTFTKNLAYEE